jgi:hypothetical protein
VAHGTARPAAWAGVLAVALLPAAGGAGAPAARLDTAVRRPTTHAPDARPPKDDADSRRARLRAALEKLPHQIVFERYDGANWDLYRIRVDGSDPVNLTSSPRGHEMYPHVSPDGSRICFVLDEGEGRSRTRSVWCMEADGTARTLVARNARQPCWGPGGREILYTKGEYERFTYSSYGTRGLFFYDTKSRKHRRHPNGAILHACYLCWSPGGRWIFATVHGAMGHGHANLAFEANGTGAFPLPPIRGCRIDVRPDGRKIAWNVTDHAIAVGDLDLSARPPKVTRPHVVIQCDRKHKVYHADFSPCGRYLAFSSGPSGPQHVGLVAKGWHICVADAAEKNVWVAVTRGGVSNKEPDWLPARGGR